MDEKTKVVVFTCNNRECQCLKEGVGLYFFTIDPALAAKHSTDNMSMMWIEEMHILQFLSMKRTNNILMAANPPQSVNVPKTATF